MTKLRIVVSTAACAVAGAAIMLLVQPPRSEAQSGPVQVRVVNGPARPVLAQLAPEETFRTVTAIFLAEGAGQNAIEVGPVPAGKRLVIESVEVWADASVGKPIRIVAFRTGVFAHAIAM